MCRRWAPRALVVLVWCPLARCLKRGRSREALSVKAEFRPAEAAAAVAVQHAPRAQSDRIVQKKSWTSTATTPPLATAAPSHLISNIQLHTWCPASCTTLAPCTLGCIMVAFLHRMSCLRPGALRTEALTLASCMQIRGALQAKDLTPT